MTLFGIAAAKLLAIFAGAGAAVVVLYLLKLRRRRVEVPYARLWARVAGQRESTALLKRLRRLVSLALQLLFLGLCVFALGDPRLGVGALSGRSVVLLVDASASMKTRDGTPTRMAEAREAAKKIVRGLGGADLCMVVHLDGQPRPVTGFTGDRPALLRAIDSLQASDSPAGLLAGLRLASDALQGRPQPVLILVGDGAYPADALAAVTWERPPVGAGSQPASQPRRPPRRVSATQARSSRGPARASTQPGADGADTLEVLDPVSLAGVAASFVPVGSKGDNLGIVAFNARRYPRNKRSHEVLLEIQSFRERATEVKLELLADGAIIDLRTLTIPPGERVRRLYPDLPTTGRRLEARLSPPGDSKATLDSFPLDDHAFALLPRQRRLKVLLVSTGNLFLEGALLALAGPRGEEHLEYQRVSPSAYRGAPADVDLAIFDGFTPPEQPRSRAVLYLDPKGDASPFATRGEMQRPLVTDVARRHPVTRWLALTDTNISRATIFTPEKGDVVLASSFRRPLMVARQSKGQKLLAIGFDLRRSDLPMRPAFPLLMANAFDWCAGEESELIATYRTGETWRIPVSDGTEEITVTPPGRPPRPVPVHDGRAAYYGQHVGYHTVALPGGEQLLAANLASPAESRTNPSRTLVLGGRSLGPPAGFAASLRRDLWLYLLIGALLLTLVEWWTYNRRHTI